MPDSAPSAGTARRRSSARSAAAAALAQVGVGQDHDELVAAVAGDAVERAELADERLHDLRAAPRRPPGGRGRR